MAEKKWVVTDVAHATYLDDLSISPQDVGGSADGYSVTKKTLRGGLTDGVDVISVGALTHSAPSLDLGLDITE